jgi:hypothetical protein
MIGIIVFTTLNMYCLESFVIIKLLCIDTFLKIIFRHTPHEVIFLQLPRNVYYSRKIYKLVSYKATQITTKPQIRSLQFQSKAHNKHPCVLNRYANITVELCLFVYNLSVSSNVDPTELCPLDSHDCNHRHGVLVGDLTVVGDFWLR